MRQVDRLPDLVADCARCAAVCCVATSFDASEDFAFTKPAGVGCRHLRRDCRCAVHDQLVERGLRGCAIYDCHGAGPRVTRAFAGRNDCDRERNEAFLVLRVVHELLWLLTRAAGLCRHSCAAARGDQSDHELARDIDRDVLRAIDRDIARAISALEAIARLPPAELLAIDAQPQVDRARAVLRRTGEALGDRQRAEELLAVARERA